MKPTAFALLCALIARILWFAPWWCSAALLAGFAIGLAGEAVLSRRRMKRWAKENELHVQVDNWKPCGARKEIVPGIFVHCVKRAGHDGDDVDHLAGRDDLYWAGN